MYSYIIYIQKPVGKKKGKHKLSLPFLLTCNDITSLSVVFWSSLRLQISYPYPKVLGKYR